MCHASSTSTTRSGKAGEQAVHTPRNPPPVTSTDTPACCRFTVWAVLYVLGRLLTLSLSVLTVGFGLAGAPQQGLDLASGNFNVLFVR